MIGIGIERIDYTKGIPERLQALDRFFERFPNIASELTYIQVGVPEPGAYSLRTAPSTRRSTAWSSESTGNGARSRWRPVIYFKRHFSMVEMAALHRMADFCIVSSLHDGMNLVAKEFVASRLDEDGVLLLSQFAGAALS